MNIEHIALTITDHKEIKEFYQEILGFAEIKSFILQKELAREIFGLGKESRVFHLQTNDLMLELFLIPERFENVHNHICFSVPNREAIVNKAIRDGYACIRVRRQHSDMIFLKDKSGNLFELKQIQ